jgi:hypothetical protein
MTNIKLSSKAKEILGFEMFNLICSALLGLFYEFVLPGMIVPPGKFLMVAGPCYVFLSVWIFVSVWFHPAGTKPKPKAKAPVPPEKETHN